MEVPRRGAWIVDKWMMEGLNGRVFDYKAGWLVCPFTYGRLNSYNYNFRDFTGGVGVSCLLEETVGIEI